MSKDTERKTSGAVVFPISDGKNVLIAREYNFLKYPPYLKFNSGGIEIGETPEEAAVRKFEEETPFKDVPIVEKILLNIQTIPATPGKNREHIQYCILILLPSRSLEGLLHDVKRHVSPLEEIFDYTAIPAEHLHQEEQFHPGQKLLREKVEEYLLQKGSSFGTPTTP